MTFRVPQAGGKSAPLAFCSSPTVFISSLHLISSKLCYFVRWAKCGEWFPSLNMLAAHVSETHAVAGCEGLFYCHWEGCARSHRGFNARSVLYIRFGFYLFFQMFMLFHTGQLKIETFKLTRRLRLRYLNQGLRGLRIMRPKHSWQGIASIHQEYCTYTATKITRLVVEKIGRNSQPYL